jgi:hypothetical protein
MGLHASEDAIPAGARVLRFMPRACVAASPYALVGDVGNMVETLHERRERWGLSYFACDGDEIEHFIPVVRRLAG